MTPKKKTRSGKVRENQRHTEPLKLRCPPDLAERARRVSQANKVELRTLLEIGADVLEFGSKTDFLRDLVPLLRRITLARSVHQMGEPGYLETLSSSLPEDARKRFREDWAGWVAADLKELLERVLRA